MRQANPGSLDDLIARIDAQVAASASTPHGSGLSAEEISRARSAPRQHVVVSLAGFRCAVPIENVVETNYSPALTFVPRVPPWVAGVTNLRGDVLAVVDLRHLLGFEPLERRVLARLLVGQSTSFDCRAGFLVEGLHGALGVAEPSIARNGAPLDSRLAEVSGGTVEREEGPIALLDLEAVFRLPAMRSLREA